MAVLNAMVLLSILTGLFMLAVVSTLVHELLFERDATFLIECSDIRHSEEMISK